jgi:hypothetical protein
VQQHPARFCFAEKVHGGPFSTGDAKGKVGEFSANPFSFSRTRPSKWSTRGTREEWCSDYGAIRCIQNLRWFDEADQRERE